MRLRQNRLKTFYHRAAISKKDNEGNSYVEYAGAVPFSAEEWPAGGKRQAELYGARLPMIRNLRLEGAFAESRAENGALVYEVREDLRIAAGDGICLHVAESAEPDYRVVAIYPYRFLTLEVEKL